MKRISIAVAILLMAAALLAGVCPAISLGATAHTINVFGDPQEADPTSPDLSPGFQFIVPFLAQTGADAAICLGDISRLEGYTQAQVDDRYSTFLNEYALTGMPVSSTVWVQGNHDAVSDMQRTEWAKYFGQPADLHAWGLYQVDGLNVLQVQNWAPGYDGYIGYYGEGDARNSPQANWLVSTLQSLPANAWVVVAMHEPISESLYTNHGESALLEALFAKYGVDLVLAGHDHDYRRHMDLSGIPYITDGMAGGPPGPTSVPTPDQYDTVMYSGADYNPMAFGHMTLGFDGATLHATAYAAQLGATAMQQIDSFGVSNRSAQPTPSFTSPAGGEYYLTGTSQTVSFGLSSALSGGKVRVCAVDGAGTSFTLTTIAATSQTSYSLPVTLPTSMTPGSTCYINVLWQPTSTSGWQELAESNTFTVATPPSVSYVSPAGGESWLGGNTYTVSFNLSSALPVGQFRIYFSDGASKWFTLTTVAATAGQTSYSVPATLPASMTSGSTCRIYVYWRSDPNSAWQLSTKSKTFTATALPTFTFTSPAGGESWLTGSSQTVSFNLSGALPGGQLRIYVSDGAGKWSTLATFAVTSQTSYSVPVTLPATMTPGSACRIYLWWQASSTSSWQQLVYSNTFAVMAALPSLTFTSPAGGENWLTGSSQTVNFKLSSALPGGQLRVYISDAASKWFTLTTVAANAGQTSYSVPVTLPTSVTTGSGCRIYVWWQASSTASWQQLAKSNTFTLAPAVPTLTITSPAGGEYWLTGSSQTVGFTLSGPLSGGQLRVYVSDGVSKWFTLTTVPATSQTSYSVPVTLPVSMTAGSGCRMYVWWQPSSTASWQQLAKSNTFTTAVQPTLAFTSPAGGENWLAGTTQTVSFGLSSALAAGQFQISVVDGAGTSFTLATVPATSGQTSYSVPVTLPTTMTPGSACRVYVWWRASSTSSWQQLAKSNTLTVAGLPGLTFSSPAGGEDWLVGTTQTVGFTLSSALPGGQLSISMIDGAGTSFTLATVPATSGQTSYSVPVTLPNAMTPGSTCYVVVSWQANAASSWLKLAQSNAFTVASLPGLTFTSPAGGEIWPAGSPQAVSFTLSSALTGGQLSISVVDGAGTSFTLTTFSATPGQTDYTGVPVILPITMTPGTGCYISVSWQANAASSWQSLAQSNAFTVPV